MGQTVVYIGNWGFRLEQKRDFGITVCRYDSDTGDLKEIETCLKGVHVGCMCINKEKNMLYCVDEQMGLPQLGGTVGGGRVFALKIDRESGKLTELNHQYTFAPMPTYCALNDEGTALILANHSGFGNAVTSVKDAFGNYQLQIVYSDVPTVLYPLDKDGSIMPPCDMYKHPTRYANEKEFRPVLHSVLKAPDKNLYFVCDIGTHQIYSFYIEEKQLKVCGCFQADLGSGPRYGCVHPDKPFYFYNHEKSTKVVALRYEENGTLHRINDVDICPATYDVSLALESSDLKLHPNGKYLYNVLRGNNMVSVMEINQETGELKLLQNMHFDATTSCCGGARGCSVSPDGKFFYLCITYDGNLIRYHLDENGKLCGEPERITVGNPANMIFVS